MSTLNFSINGRKVTNTKYIGQSRQFSISVDEPQALGGEDTAPNPVEYLLAGYAGCLNVVFNLVAKELDITIHQLRININGDINPGKFLGLSNDDRAGFKSLNVQIELETNANEEREQILIEKVKERCPVNDNLSNATPVSYLITKPICQN